MADYARPVAKAEIKLSEEERKRIAADLKLDEDQLDLIPEKLDIARYDEDAVGDDVSAFLVSLAGNPKALPERGEFGGPNLQLGRIPGGILVPV